LKALRPRAEKENRFRKREKDVPAKRMGRLRIKVVHAHVRTVGP